MKDWMTEVRDEMDRAREKFPKPDLLLSAFSKEAGEVVKAVLDAMVGKATLTDVRKELIQAAAMAGRLLEEGDPVHKLDPPLHPPESTLRPAFLVPPGGLTLTPYQLEVLQAVWRSLSPSERIFPCVGGVNCRGFDSTLVRAALFVEEPSAPPTAPDPSTSTQAPLGWFRDGTPVPFYYLCWACQGTGETKAAVKHKMGCPNLHGTRALNLES